MTSRRARIAAATLGAGLAAGIALGLVMYTVAPLGLSSEATSLIGALSVTVLGTGTIAVMIKAAWLRNWLYHGPHLLYGVQNLSSLLKTPPAIAYSHQLTGAVDAGVFSFLLLAFPVIALMPTACAAMNVAGDAATGQSGPERGGGSPGPAPAPDDGQPAAADHHPGPAANLPGLHEPDLDAGQDPLADSLGDTAAIHLAGAREP